MSDDLLVKTVEHKDERNPFIDFLKGVAVFLVVWGHVIQYSYGGSDEFYDNQLFKFIYSFHMPLFMLISGYLCFYSAKKYSYEKFFLKRVRGIVIPFLVFGFLCAIAGNINNFSELLNLKGIYTFFNYILYVGYWFLFAVFVCSMSMVLIEKSFALYNGKNRILKIFLYVIAVLSGAYLCSILPYADQTLYMYPYFVIGFLYCRFREKISTLYKCIFSIISLIAFIVMLCFFQREHYIYTTGMFLPTPSKGVSQLATDLFRYSIGLFGSIAVSSVLYLLSRVLWKKIINVFAAIGKKSLQLYLVQRLLVEYICGDLYVDLVGKLGYNPLIQNLYLYNIIITPLIACAFIVIMYAVIILLYKFKRFSTFIFGR